MNAQQSAGNPFEAVETASGGILGVAALHMELSRMIGWRSNERFPMMDIRMLPILVRALVQAERGLLPWNKMLRIGPLSMGPGHSPLRDHYPDGAVVTFGQLFEAMIVDSDNTASDVILRKSGGAEALQADLERFRLASIRIDRSEAEMAEDFEKLGPHGFASDGRDSATPEAMALFLTGLHEGTILQKKTKEVLYQWMAATPWGARRIKAGLPPGTPFWHKAGTGPTQNGINLCTNDAGIARLPDGKGHVAIATFLKLSSRDVAARESTLADAARIAFNYWAAQGSK